METELKYCRDSKENDGKIGLSDLSSVLLSVITASFTPAFEIVGFNVTVIIVERLVAVSARCSNQFLFVLQPYVILTTFYNTTISTTPGCQLSMTKEKVFQSVKSGLIQSGRGLQNKLHIGRSEGFTRLSLRKIVKLE